MKQERAENKCLIYVVLPWNLNSHDLFIFIKSFGPKSSDLILTGSSLLSWSARFQEYQKILAFPSFSGSLQSRQLSPIFVFALYHYPKVVNIYLKYDFLLFSMTFELLLRAILAVL
mmetsp:Transcript_8297/g.10826  ORF Transcript_8297/g.10826 Transcript_8297/m.10826 type:complete len:116 (+) Transcript_8297:782-1129(+)